MNKIIQIPTLLNKDTKNYRENHQRVLSIEERLELYKKAYNSLKKDLLKTEGHEREMVQDLLEKLRAIGITEQVRRDEYILRNQKVDSNEYRLNVIGANEE